MAAIDDFKANLIGGGARANQYRVTITAPTGIAIGMDVRRTSFLVTTSSLPAMTLTPIAVPFRGRSIYIAGDREFGTEWTTTFINDTDFMIRTAMEKWSNGINDLANATGVNRPIEKVILDVKNDLVSIKGAREDYGVVFTEKESL